MINRMLMACLAAGLLAGLATAALQEFSTTPLILKAEAFESSKTTTSSSAQHSNMTGPSAQMQHLILVHSKAPLMPSPNQVGSEAKEWAPADGAMRTFYTSVSTIAAAFGFALMLLAAMIISGAKITARTGLAWGAAAFVVTGLAPALGLSPELPGSAAADLAGRQTWWLGTAVATAIGLFLAVRISTPLTILAGIVLICLPHIIGAPHPHTFLSDVPAELSAHFASSSLVVHAVMWGLVGSIMGYVWQRSDGPETA